MSKSVQNIPSIRKFENEAKAIKKCIEMDGGQAKLTSIRTGIAKAWGFGSWEALVAAAGKAKPAAKETLVISRLEETGTCISDGLYAFLLAEIENEAHGGETPATLDSAIRSLGQMDEGVFANLNPQMAVAEQDRGQVLAELRSLWIDFGRNLVVEKLVLQYERKKGADRLHQPILPMRCIVQSVNSATGAPLEDLYEVPFDAETAIANLTATDIARLAESDWTDVDALWRLFKGAERENSKLQNARAFYPTVEILLADEIDPDKATEWVMRKRPTARPIRRLMQEGWTVNPDLDHEGQFCFMTPEGKGSAIAYGGEDGAWEAAGANEGKFVRVEYDLDFFGGGYDDVGEFTNIPLALCDAYGIEEAFRRYAHINPRHIVHYSEDEIYGPDDELIDDL